MPAAPISLYIDLEPGRTAELEAVAKASLAFAAGLRETAFLIDPSFEFRIELERGDEGSLWLKAFIRWVRGLGHAHPTIMAVVVGSGSWFALETVSYTYEKILDHLLNSRDPEIVQLAPDQMEEIARRVATIGEARGPKEHFAGVYRELAKDTAVRGVGVSSSHVTKPRVIIPRDQFYERANLIGDVPPLVGARRMRPDRGDFVIIRPVLKEGGGKWRLAGPHGEFSATIADGDFYATVLDGEAPVPLAAEIHMTADLETTDEMTVDGVWKPISHKIVKVYELRRQPRQQPLFPPR